MTDSIESLRSQVTMLTAEAGKWRGAASVLCGAHIGQAARGCPICELEAVQRERDEAQMDASASHTMAFQWQQTARDREVQLEGDRHRSAALTRERDTLETRAREASELLSEWQTRAQELRQENSRLTARFAELEEGLRPFASAEVRAFGQPHDIEPTYAVVEHPPVECYQRASALLSPLPTPTHTDIMVPPESISELPDTTPAPRRVPSERTHLEALVEAAKNLLRRYIGDVRQSAAMDAEWTALHEAIGSPRLFSAAVAAAEKNTAAGAEGASRSSTAEPGPFTAAERVSHPSPRTDDAQARDLNTGDGRKPAVADHDGTAATVSVGVASPASTWESATMRCEQHGWVMHHRASSADPWLCWYCDWRERHPPSVSPTSSADRSPRDDSAKTQRIGDPAYFSHVSDLCDDWDARPEPAGVGRSEPAPYARAALAVELAEATDALAISCGWLDDETTWTTPVAKRFARALAAWRAQAGK